MLPNPVADHLCVLHTKPCTAPTQVNEQLLMQPSAVLMSVVQALHVLRAVLQEVSLLV